MDVDEPFEYVDFAVTPDVAEQAAATYLSAEGVDTESYRKVTTQLNQVDGNALKYRMERGGLAVVDELYENHIQASLWHVRFFKPQEKEEYQVWINASDTMVYTVRHLQEEEALGADLEEEEAQLLAEAHMRRFGFDPGEFELKESSSEKLKERRDHTFVWEAREGDARNLDESFFRCEVTVSGDRPSFLRRYIKLPETWLRERGESTAFRMVLIGILVVASLSAFFHLLWLFIRQIRAGTIDWKPPLKLGAVAIVLYLISTLNGLPTFYAGYSTETTTTVHIINGIVRIVLLGGMIGLLMAATLGLTSALYPGRLERLLSRQPTVVFRDAAATAILAFAAGKFFDHIGALLNHHFAAFAGPPSAPGVAGLQSALPFWTGLNSSLLAAFVMPVSAAIILYYALRVLEKPAYVVIAVLAIGAAGVGGSAHNAGEFYLGIGQYLLQVVSFALIVYFFLRDNVLAYVLLGFLAAAAEGSFQLMSQSASLYQIHGGLWLFLSVLLVGAVWARFFRPTRASA